MKKKTIVDRFCACIAVMTVSVGLYAEDNVAKESADDSAYKINFTRTEKVKGRDFPKGWALKGTKWGTPDTSFYIRNDQNCDGNVLVVDAQKSTGAILYDVYRHVDLNKTPVMRWRWRALALPKGADGRVSGKDDQVMSLYLGAGGFVRKSIAYRWETETPIGAQGNICYGGGLVKVAWYCMNNKTTPLEKWIVLERNVAEDFKRIYGEIPKEFVISVGGNSQYTKSNSKGEIDFIEFLPANTSKEVVKKAEESRVGNEVALRSKPTEGIGVIR